jgi:hypothetical protein
MTYTTTTRRGANHGLHLFLSIITMGLWAVTGWPIAAIMGRRQTVTTYPPMVQQTNAVNPYNNQPYWDHTKAAYSRPGYGGAPDIWQR